MRQPGVPMLRDWTKPDEVIAREIDVFEHMRDTSQSPERIAYAKSRLKALSQVRAERRVQAAPGADAAGG